MSYKITVSENTQPLLGDGWIVIDAGGGPTYANASGGPTYASADGRLVLNNRVKFDDRYFLAWVPRDYVERVIALPALDMVADLEAFVAKFNATVSGIEAVLDLPCEPSPNGFYDASWENGVRLLPSFVRNGDKEFVIEIVDEEGTPLKKNAVKYSLPVKSIVAAAVQLLEGGELV